MTYSYTQVSQYLAWPRRDHHLDGWDEKEVRASMLFGRPFEQALAPHFLGRNGAAALAQAGAAVCDMELEYGKGESWEQMLQQGVQLPKRFAQGDRVRIVEPGRHLQVKVDGRRKLLKRRNRLLPTKHPPRVSPPAEIFHPDLGILIRPHEHHRRVA